MNTKHKPTSLGHISAIITILIWGSTFISTKVLLRSFTPVEILFTRFLIGYATLLILHPHKMQTRGKRQEGLFMTAGLSGITLYYLLENIALTYTTASNVGIIITISPFFTAILSCWFLKSEKPKRQFYIGFLAAIAGILLISYNPGNALKLNPAGDLLAVLAAMAWAVYSILTRKISQLGYPTIQTTRRVFFYGILFMLPMLFFTNFQPNFKRFAVPANLANLLFLGVAASALCFITWNTAVKLLGAIKTSVYIYLVPVVTVTASFFILKEPLTPALISGAALTLAGLWISETGFFEKCAAKSRAKNSI